MLNLSVPRITVLGTGMAVPASVAGAPAGLTGRVDNATLLAHRYNPEDPRAADQAAFLARDLADRVGLLERHHAHAFGGGLLPEEPTSSDLAVMACGAALDSAGIAVDAVGALLMATSTPHRWTATAAASAAAALGFRGPFMDLRMGCAGGLAALAQGAMWAAASGKPVLVVGADTFSRAVPPRQVLAALALGDAAAAAVVAPGSGALAAALHGDASLGNLMTTQGTLPPTAEQLAGHAYTLSGDPEAMAQASVPLYRAVTGALAKGSPDRVLLHQTQRPLLAAVTQACGLTHVDAPSWLGRFANTGTANVLLGLHLQRVEWGGLNGTTLMAAVGGGVGASAVWLDL